MGYKVVTSNGKWHVHK